MSYNITEIDNLYCTREKIKETISDLLKTQKIYIIVIMIKSNKLLIDSIIEKTNYLDVNVRISERLFHIMNNLYNKQKCIQCGNIVNFNTYIKGYRKYCCTQCVGLNKENKKNTKVTRFKNNGCYYNIEKFEKTMIERHGVKNNFGRKDVQEKSAKKLRTKETKQKRENTCLSLFGYKNSFQSPTTKITLMTKYNVENIMQIEDVMRKASANGKKSMSTKAYNSIFGEIFYQTKPELDLIVYCEKNNIKIKNGPVLKYFFNGKNHFYYVDFETDNFLIEIKSKHKWYFEDLKSGKLDAKNSIANNYSENNNKQFLFILDDFNFEKYLGKKLWVTE